jgi:hypothetical protein
MGWDSKDVYSNPEDFGLTIVGSAEASLYYEFDMFVVWMDSSFSMYYASDSGCSCPSPFESYTTIEDLTKAKNVQEVHDALDSWADGSHNDDDRSSEAANLHARLAMA